jgi:LPXTG-motif cell wall-anchored protein
MAGETIYATAFERPLSRNLFKPDELNGNYFTDVANYPTPEEYVYRITRTPNVEATSVDHQSNDGYEMLSATAQQDWYSEISPTTPYLFSWKAFMCVGSGAPSIPTQLSSRYASREDGIRPNSSFSSYHNDRFRDAATAWISAASPSTRTLVGPTISVGGGYTEALLGDPDSNGYWSKALGILDVTSSCGVGKTLEALTIVDSGDNPITTKAFVIPSQLRLDVPGTNVLVDSTGITIGVTGGLAAPEFHAALWGLTTVFDSTTPTPTPTTPPLAALATTGANVEWLFVAGLLAVIAGSGFIAFSRRKRTW